MADHDRTLSAAALSAGHYLHWGVISVSVTNLAIIGVMVVVFVARAAAAVPAPRERAGRGRAHRAGRAAVSAGSGRDRGRRAAAAAGPARLRDRIAGLVPAGQALPDRQPAYVASWIYVFGVLTLAALLVVLGHRRAARRGRRGVVAHLVARATS